ncbi:hypothetical protein GGS21DRAFT_387272 [Xylaria nigripes]|nr:hypothetical protein GGS21DRAFT_387272 [Xylaria nigripes]
MSHFSRSHAVNSDLKSDHDEPDSTLSTSNNGRKPDSRGDQKSPYQGKIPKASRGDFFLRGHARATSLQSQTSPPWVNHDTLSIADSPPITVANRNRSRTPNSSRPLSIIQAYQPPRMDVDQDTIPELQPIFTFLNSHANKLFQEGYFLKLDDQNIQGKTNVDRTWTECFAQLVGTVLSLWDAAELDAAGENGEVLPKFINLTDASIKMIDSIPTSNENQTLQNILSISTAGRNRYLLHFNSRSSLIQWTSGIRLAMFEHATLQEAYTGALIAGKGKNLNNIGLIMERSRIPVDQWVRVRFGAGVPWRRCWCVISPPDEKEYQKALKEHKKKSPYDRSHPPVLKGVIKFYDQKKDGKKQRKMQPIATINDAYSAYALYPQSKSLIEASTLIKIEGDMTIHADPPSVSEGFVFIMPEVNPAVSGFEMMLRFLFPTWDSFGLYGRPGRLVASVLDSRSLMFAMPKHRRYGYLELLDVSSLISTDGSAGWNEREWRQRLKELTGTRMNTILDESESAHTSRTNSSKKRQPRVGFADESPHPGIGSPTSTSVISGSEGRNESAFMDRDGAPSAMTDTTPGHTRPQVPRHTGSPYSDSSSLGLGPSPARTYLGDFADPAGSDGERTGAHFRELDGIRSLQTPEPVSRPPMFAHAPEDKPNNRSYHAPNMRHASNRFSMDTLDYLSKTGGMPVGHDRSGPDSGRDSDRQEQLSHQNPGHYLQSQTPRPKTPTSRPGTATGNRPPAQPNYGTPQGSYSSYHGPQSAGTPSGAPGMAPPDRGRGHPPPNMLPPSHSHSGARSQGMYHGSQPSQPGPGGNGQPRSLQSAPRESLPPLNTSPIHRKPLPVRSDSLKPRSGLENVTSATDSSNSESLTGNRIDAGGFGQVRTQNMSRVAPPPGVRRYNTWVSEASSQYDDGVSTSSPDYASSRPSTGKSSLVERPRAGVLRTVGAGGDISPPTGEISFDIPGIDFGPTLNYATAPQSLTLGGSGASQTSNQTSNPPSRRTQSPSGALPHQRTLSEVSQSQHGSDENKRRSVIWQPAATTAGSSGSSGPGLSAEEFVQQRVTAAAATPLYAHQRHSSGITLSGYRTGTPTALSARSQDKDHVGSAHSRSGSYDLLQRSSSQIASELPQRPKSGDLLQRPGSRGAGAILGGQQSLGESHLSAREQEHVARVTGSPLINMAGNKSTAPSSGGLVGAIEVRERGREQMKQGWTSPAAQNAIQRQQHQPYQQYQQSTTSPTTPPPAGIYSNINQGMVSQPRQQGFGLPRSYSNSGPGLEQGNWMSGSGGFRSPPPGNMDPRFVPPQGQFPSSSPFPSGPQGGSGGGYAYHSKAF